MPRTSRKVAQDGRTPALERVGRDPVELDDVVGDEPVAARDELERQLALADRRRAGDEHAHLEDVEEHAVERRRLGEHARQIQPDDFDQVRRRLQRSEQRDVMRIALSGEVARHLLAVGDDDRDELVGEQAIEQRLEITLGKRLADRRAPRPR